MAGAVDIELTVLEPTSAASANFSAVLLAGGRSTRMGQDKAGLVFDGEPLWQRQLATLRETKPGELFISGQSTGPYRDAGLPIVGDDTPGLGPLGGLAAALRHARHSQLLVLAVDLPMMTARFLSELAARGPVVPRTADWFEPLAAVYPRLCLPLVEECLGQSDRSMQCFLRLAVARRLVNIRELSREELPLFRNLNSPADC